MNTELIVTTVFLVLFIIGFVAQLVIHFAKSDKVKKGAMTTMFLVDQAKKYVKQAELLVDSSGAEKKKFVEANVNNMCKINGIKYEESKVSNIIEDLVKLMNTNKNKEAKPVEFGTHEVVEKAPIEIKATVIEETKPVTNEEVTPHDH